MCFETLLLVLLIESAYLCLHIYVPFYREVLVLCKLESSKCDNSCNCEFVCCVFFVLCCFHFIYLYNSNDQKIHYRVVFPLREQTFFFASFPDC